MPLARRGALTALLALGLLAIALGWVTAGQVTAPSERTYREAVLGQPLRVNPLLAPANQAEADLTALIFSGLMRLRPDGMPEPELAERWEVTPDRLTYTFHLRRDATWHDGIAVDAEDVAFTIRRLQDEAVDADPQLRAQWAGVQVFVADPLTVLMRLPEPAADFLARATLGVLPEHLAAEMATGGGFETPPFDRSPIGTGPFRLTSLDAERALLRHNTSYLRGTPPISRVELRFAERVGQQVEWLERGDVNAALLAESTPRETVAELVDGRDDLRATRLPGDSLTMLYFNNLRPPLNDATTRRALAAAIDRSAALRASGSTEQTGAGVIPPASWAFTPPEPSSVGGTDLWTAAGWERSADERLQREGQPLALELVTNGEPDRVALAEAIAAQLREAGVTVEVVTAPAQRVISDYLRAGAYDLALFGWETPVEPDPYAGWHTSQLGAGNVAGFSDSEADALLEAARTTLDVAERRELYALFTQRFEELGASLVVSYPAPPYVLPADLTGFAPRLLVSPESRFQDIHLWRFAE